MKRWIVFLAAAVIGSGFLLMACDDSKEEKAQKELPFEFLRADVGEPVTDAERTAFTKKITGFLKQVGYFDWIWRTSHGMDASNDQGWPDYRVYWQDTSAEKSGDTITFHHTGGADNIMIRTPKIMTQAISGYLMFGDEQMGDIAAQFAKGIAAGFMGMEFGDNDTEKFITARTVFNNNHSYELEGGRKVVVDYDPVKVRKEDWNAHTHPNADNPYWGSIWLRNMRSKDDVPHMLRSVFYLNELVRKTNDEEIKAAAELALYYLSGFSRDIVDQGYYIRTKGEDGVAHIPYDYDTGDTTDYKDLASFNAFDGISPGGECTAKLNFGLVGYGDTQGNECGVGDGGLYEQMATHGHYFNYAIIRYFHVAAVVNALEAGENDVAYELLTGLADRFDTAINDDSERDEHERWDAELVPLFLAGAAAGLPLTSEEVRLIWTKYSESADFYAQWPNWDLWDASVPDGSVEWKPNDEGMYIRPEDLAAVLEYCYSPYRNKAGVMAVDCDIVADPSRWGE